MSKKKKSQHAILLCTFRPELPEAGGSSKRKPFDRIDHLLYGGPNMQVVDFKLAFRV